MGPRAAIPHSGSGHLVRASLRAASARQDFEATIDSARAFLYAASVMLLVRRIARAS
jgi:hypothetical protein